jgi:hypothetical protein
MQRRPTLILLQEQAKDFVMLLIYSFEPNGNIARGGNILLQSGPFLEWVVEAQQRKEAVFLLEGMCLKKVIDSQEECSASVLSFQKTVRVRFRRLTVFKDRRKKVTVKESETCNIPQSIISNQMKKKSMKSHVCQTFKSIERQNCKGRTGLVIPNRI